MKVWTLGAALIGLTSASISGVAHADFRMLSQGYSSFNAGMNKIANDRLLNQRLMRSIQSRSKEPVSGPDHDDQATTTALTYVPLANRRFANYASFIERTRRFDPAGADGLAASLKLDPVALAEPELAKVGLRIDNVADAYAVYWVEAWQAVHGVTSASSRTAALAVRAQAARAISATPEFASATAAQKQEFAEAYLVQAVLVGAAKEQANGDPAKLAQVSAAVEKGARAAGLDLRAMTLTEEGFRPAG